jgi:hypothetical protein
MVFKLNDFIHPAPGSRTTSNFGKRVIYGKEETHLGIDYAQSGKVSILAAADGVVKDIWPEKASTYGNVVFLTHVINGKTYETVYAHLKSNAVKVGQKVKQGEIIGLMGNTGRSTGQHLHFELHDGKYIKGRPNAVDPSLYVQKGKVLSAGKKVLVLPKTVSKWAVYPLDKQPIKANAIGFLNPKKFGGLEYHILSSEGNNVYAISTSNFGIVKIYADKSTGAIIK